ncbi:MAG: hypothetical protein GTO51_04305 [Candidatus Latescibacteria bacterium]|nr:hypothetical protein [Candidatus Latescibacterota bacterium]NIM21063.1 hypothetical protein [Candidatus Latescibacterota bacterium]NIM65198.1 hypothetical protein [Candidatus Latescibacterota bacterium]NIO01713.1 hypothetical protein [Candidatus Latescibacterota bacterium]NIO28230.1 hypothetical protein [Candidatus Latescibacterota bacterium]
MIIQCQSCSAKYLLPESKMPPKPIKVQCPKCKAIFMLSPQKHKVAAPAPAGAAAPGQDVPAASKEAPAHVEVPPATPAPKAKKSKSRTKEERAKRLARVLVSDILCYNREKRDQALIDGNLMSVLGEEIKKSWELYKEKVGPEVASSTNFFKEALNEILADGQKVF